jgi:hypothetical protein
MLIAETEKLSASGWTMMIGCISAVCLLVVFCFYRVLRESSPTEHHHAPLDIDTHDRDS